MAYIQMSKRELDRTPAPPVALGLGLFSVFAVLLAAFGSGAFLRYVTASGHPFMAGWLATMFLAWLFLLGSSKASSGA